jgi:hypothetical protein
MHSPSLEGHRKGRWGFKDQSESGSESDDGAEESEVEVVFEGQSGENEPDGPTDYDQLLAFLRWSVATGNRQIGVCGLASFLVFVVLLAIAVNNTGKALFAGVSLAPWPPAPAELGWPMHFSVIRGLNITNLTRPNSTCLEWDGCCSSPEVGMYTGFLLILAAFLGVLAVPATWVAARDTKKHADYRASMAMFCCYMVCPFVTVYLPTVIVCLFFCVSLSTTQLLFFARVSMWEGVALAGWCVLLVASSAYGGRRRATIVAGTMALLHVAWAAGGVVLPGAVGIIRRPEFGDEWGTMYQLTNEFGNASVADQEPALDENGDPVILFVVDECLPAEATYVEEMGCGCCSMVVTGHHPRLWEPRESMRHARRRVCVVRVCVAMEASCSAVVVDVVVERCVDLNSFLSFFLSRSFLLLPQGTTVYGRSSTAVCSSRSLS